MIEQILHDIYEKLKDKVLYVTFSGSKAYPFLKNTHDLDVIFVVANQDDKRICLDRYIRNFNIKEITQTYHLDIHFAIESYDKTYYIIQNHYAEKYWPYENLDFPRCNYSFNLETDKEKLKEMIVSVYNHVKEIHERRTDINIYNSKKWYHIYLCLCILHNDSFDLTEEQIDNINILHDIIDLSTKEQRKQLIDEMISEVEQWQI